MNKIRIKKFDIISVAKMYAAMSLVMALIIAIPYGLGIIIFSLVGAAGAAGSSGSGALALGGFGIVGGIAMMIIFPIVNGIFGFIMGIIAALVYNIFASIVGGIAFEIENVA